MFLQSILVYTSLIVLMLLFSLSVSKNSFVLSNQESIKQKSFFRFNTLMPLLVFAVVFGMRYDVGVDHLSYMHGYLTKTYIGKDEYFFYFFSDLGWYFNWHYTIYFGILAFIQVFFFFYAFNKERYLFPFLVFFIFTNGVVLPWMNGIRQSLAMCIWIFALQYIHKRKLIYYVLWCLIAMMFHKSAIILIALYPLLRLGKDYFHNILFQLIILVSCFIINVSFGGLFLKLEGLVTFYTSVLGEDKYRNYNIDGLTESFKESSGTNIAFYFKILINVIIILYSKKLKEYYKSHRFIIFYTLFFIGIITTYVFPIGYISLTRPFRYFYIFQSIMIAYLCYYLYRKRNIVTNSYLMLFIILAFIAIFVLSQYTASEFSHSLYQFYFEHNLWGYPNR